MNRSRIIDDISQVARHLWEKGWAERNAGNISVNVTRLLPLTDPEMFSELPSEPLQVPRPLLKGNIFIITPTGSRMRELNKNTLDQLCYIRVNDEGTGISHLGSAVFESFFPISEGGSQAGRSILQSDANFPRPSSELPTHLAIHEMFRARQPENNTVIHTHVTELIALTQIPGMKDAEKINRLLWGMHPETAMFVPKGAGFVPYSLPGTNEIAEATVKELYDHPVVIWEKHGVFSAGHSVTEAFDTIDILAKSARIYFLVKQSGFEPEGLTAEQIDEIRKIRG